ncbi:hypothetical protein LCGC14_1687000 [marine sediment metagenome]|uniref:Uncharacterized protein n=1 Tax=marine sediment metagenome TaxID=412755 RepID=A0A0F9KLZ9_9ZZZZ
MNWKETVIKLKAVPKQIFENQEDSIHAKACYATGWKDGTEIQAEISFKAGQEDVCLVSLSEILLEGIESGRKEVMEWGDEVCTDKKHSGTMKRRECGFCWQAKLKEQK